MEERFDDSSKPTKARAAVKWIAFLARKGVGWSGVDRAKKAKILSERLDDGSGLNCIRLL